MALTRSRDPLVWIDCEMTGLDATTDTILSISCFITDAELNLLEPQGYHAVIHHTEQQLTSMNQWCINQHGLSGLTQACLTSTTTATSAATGLLNYITNLIPTKRTALLAGNSIHADKMFLVHAPWNVILEHLNYRLFDVSATKEMVRRWCSDDVLVGAPVKKLNHTAREDVLESIEEARYYRGLFGRITAIIADDNGGERVSLDDETRTVGLIGLD